MLFHDVSCSIMWLFKVTSWSVSLHRSSKHPHDFCSWLWRHLHVKFWPIQSCAEKATSNGTQKISGCVDDSSCFPSLSSLCIFSGCWSKAPDSVGKFQAHPCGPCCGGILTQTHRTHQYFANPIKRRWRLPHPAWIGRVGTSIFAPRCRRRLQKDQKHGEGLKQRKDWHPDFWR